MKNMGVVPTKKGGFTLIEIAIILVIIGILVSLGVALIGPLTKRAKYIESKEIVNAAIESVIGYSITHGKLPHQVTFPTVVRNPYDAWTKPLFYIYAANLKNMHICDLTITTTNITVRVCPDVTCTTPTSTTRDVAFIVLSGGSNYNNQTAGNEEVISPKTINVYEVDVDNIDNYTGDFYRPEPYDDIVKWVSLYELKQKLGCEGAPPPPTCDLTDPTRAISLISKAPKIFYCNFTASVTECDDVVGACEELKKDDTIVVTSGEKIRFYKTRTAGKCRKADVLTVNPDSKPCLGYDSGGFCTEIKPIDVDNDCLVQGDIDKKVKNYEITDY